jgi:hypothetical protein
MVANVLQVGGLIAVAVGAGLVFVPAGLIVAGVGAILFGLALERE